MGGLGFAGELVHPQQITEMVDNLFARFGVAGGLAGIGMTWLGLRGLENVFSDYDFIQFLVTMDWQMISLAVALAIVSALCAALYPTWRACRVSPASTLRIQ